MTGGTAQSFPGSHRKLDNNKGKSLDVMIAYVDEFGNIVDTPPDPEEREEINTEDILVSGYQTPETKVSNIRKGTMTYYNEDKG